MLGRYYGRWSYTGYSPYQYNALGWVWDGFARSTEKGWENVDRVFIEAVLTEGLYWLGLVDLGYAQQVTPQGGNAPRGCWPSGSPTWDVGCWPVSRAGHPRRDRACGSPAQLPHLCLRPDLRRRPGPARWLRHAAQCGPRGRIRTRPEVMYRAQLAGQSVDGIRTWLEQVTAGAAPERQPQPRRMAGSLRASSPSTRGVVGGRLARTG